MTNPMCFILLFHSVDPHLGRIDYHSLSDQTLMELAIDDMGEKFKQKYQRDDGGYRDYPEEWRDVTQTDGAVRVIFRRVGVIGGKLQLSYLPRNVRDLTARCIPLKGCIDLTHLPGRMERLDLSRNQLTGSVDFTQLPECMRELHLNNNQFTGSLSFRHVPEGMVYLHLNDNQFEGRLIVQNHLQKLAVLNVRRNNLDAYATVCSKVRARVCYRDSGVTYVGNEYGS